jgi:uncharacterized protein YjfI (DUF2170 family)
MKAKSSAHYQREYRKRLREKGLVKKEVWILPENSGQLAAHEKILRVSNKNNLENGVENMTDTQYKWTTTSLHQALNNSDLITSGKATIELIDGIEPAIHIVMAEYGDLPVFVNVTGEQIIAESILWSTDEVTDINGFNDAVLRTHKYFPLSTISLDYVGKSGDYYHMFGALSSSSILQSVLTEIEVLANNVIEATEAYSNFLSFSIEASN